MTAVSGYLGVSQAAAQLNLSIDTVRDLFDQGRLAGVRTPSGYRRIDLESVNNFRKHLTVSGAAAALGCSAETVRHWFDVGVLEGHRTPAGHRRIDPASVEQLLASRASGPREAPGA